ncbi:alcohol dehydrogenase catalytic domain-containing protein [Ochrobactrum pseudogrignonense]|nr:alcohol dehydrogenase catalytic domain-containing protein [Brucella pseudogrignonensis]
MVVGKMSASTISVLLERPGVIALRENPLTELQPDEVRIRTGFGGICGSDLHYYSHGGFGSVKMTGPMTLGHEVVGTIDRVGQGVSGLAIGDAVCINPSQPCGECRYCREKRRDFVRTCALWEVPCEIRLNRVLSHNTSIVALKEPLSWAIKYRYTSVPWPSR